MSWLSPREFYEQFKNDPEGARRTAYRLGREIGHAFKLRFNIQGEDLEAVAEILNSAMRMVKSEPSARIEGNRVTKSDRGFCPIMRAALTLNIPWGWLDENMAWPWLEGIVSSVRPDMKLTIPSARNRGDAVCIHIFQIG